MSPILLYGIVKAVLFLVRKHRCPITLLFVSEYPTGIVLALNYEDPLLSDIEHINFRCLAIIFRDIYIP